MKLKLLFLLLPLHAAIGGCANAEDNLHFSGALVAEPCVIPSGEENISLEFGSVIDKYLYQYHRTHSQTFTLHLTQCDPSVAKTVSVTFHGTESLPLPGLLALDAGSSATGIALGLETTKGAAIPINQSTPAVPLTAGENWLSWQAYVQGEPKALKERTITPGEFSATATFELAYE